MVRFYEELNRGATKIDALRAAKAAVAAKHPAAYHWAGFICIGDPGAIRGGSEGFALRPGT